MNTKRVSSLLALTSSAALSGFGQSLVIQTAYTSNNNGGGLTAGSDLTSNQGVAVGNTISDLGASAWAHGSYTSAGTSGTTYHQATGSAWVEATATGGDDFGRMAVTMDYTDFETIWRPGTTLWYAQTIENGAITAGSYKSGVYNGTPNHALRAMNGDLVTLGVDTQDTTYNNDTTGIGHGATFLISNAPDVTLSGGTASWSVLDNSIADLDPDLGATLIDRNGGPLSLDYLLVDLAATRGLVQGFDTSVGSPFRDDVEVNLQLKITGESLVQDPLAPGSLFGTFLLGETSATLTFNADSNVPTLNFNSVDGTAIFDPSEWLDGDFTLSLEATINHLAYGHSNAFLASQLLGSLSASQDFTLFTGASAVPEPGAFALWAGLGALGLTATRRRRRHAVAP